MRKRGALFGVLLAFLILLPVIDAQQACSNPSQVLFKIEDGHGEVWNGAGNYAYEVCYDTLFGTQGNGDRTCNGNVVLRLSGDTNAHAEIPSGQTSGYQDICYGNLNCVERDNSCSQGEVEVVRLSDNTNAHIEKAGESNFNTAICCSTGSIVPQCRDGIDNDGDDLIDFPADPGCTSQEDNDESDSETGEIRNVEWRNGLQEKIIETNVNTTVKLHAETTFNQGKRVSFDIYEDDPINDDFVDSFFAITGSNGVAEYNWFIDDETYDRFKEFTGNPTFYFNASVSGSSNVSGLLELMPGEGSNTPPRANITSPVHRQIYFTGLTIEFNETSRDSEGNIVSYLWTIKEDEYETTQRSFNYVFATEGQKTITLRVEDSEGLADEHQIAVLAINSPGILGYIETPSHQQIVPELSNGRQLIIDYSGEESYVINRIDGGTCQTTGIVIECLAGNCPSKTMNYPAGCIDNVSVSGGNKPFTDIMFTWKFNDGQSFAGQGNTSGEKLFVRRSAGLNDKNIILELLYDKNGINAETETEREFTLGQCVGDSTFYEIDSEGKIIRGLDTFQEPGACAGEDGIPEREGGLNDDCCPANFACLDENGGTSGVLLCRSFETQPEFCVDYANEPACKADEFGVIQNEPNYKNDPECINGRTLNGQQVRCECTWDNNQDPEEDVCKFGKRYISGGGGEEICTDYQCLESYDKGECKNGYMQLTIHRELIPDPECPFEGGEDVCGPEEETITVPCGRPTIELPFFGKEQFISVLMVIALIYALVKFMHKEK